MTRYVECVPNFSEGTDLAVVERIAAAIGAVPGARVLDVSADRWHNRSVITYVVPIDHAVAAGFAAVHESLKLIDLTRHTGVHPRIGATDVFPFVPLHGTSMQECVDLARQLGRRVGEELAIPVYLYERAATSGDRSNLALIRRNAVRFATEGRNSEAWPPDFGPHTAHATFGAMAVGARPPLVAYNLYLGAESGIGAVRQIAASIRESAGGLPGIKALAFVVNGQAQLSLNLVDLARTSMEEVYRRVKVLSEERGLAVHSAEIVGLAPQRLLDELSDEHRRLIPSPDEKSLERRLPPGVTL
jgi:glutamate formiminotransferase